MAKTALEEIRSELKAKGEALVEVMDRIDGAKDETEETLQKWSGEFEGLKTEHEALTKKEKEIAEREKIRDGIKTEASRFSESANPMQFQLGRDGNLVPKKSISKQFIESDGYKSWLGAHAPKGKLPERDPKSGIRLPDSYPVSVDLSIKALTTGQTTWAASTDTNAAVLGRIQQAGLVDMGTWMIPAIMGIVDLVTHRPTDAEVVFYVKVTNGTAVAAETGEATSASDTSGLKPEAALTFSMANSLVRTIPVWIPVTRQALASAVELQDTIDRYLRYEVTRRLNREIIQGDGTGVNLTGVLHLPNKLTQAFDTDPIVTARKAITHLLLAGRSMPNAWAMHPTDMETYDLQQDNEARYYFGGPLGTTGVPRLWGVPTRQSEYVPQGSPIVADWTRYIVADREDTTVRASDSHSDYFARNLMAVLAEMRAATYAERDEAFCVSSMS